MLHNTLVLLTALNVAQLALGRLEPGLFQTNLTMSNHSSQMLYFHRSAYKDSVVQAEIVCGDRSTNEATSVSLRVDALLRSSPCSKEFYDTLGPGGPLANADQSLLIHQLYLDDGDSASNRPTNRIPEYGYDTFVHFKRSFTYQCDGHAHFLPTIDHYSSLATPTLGDAKRSVANVTVATAPQRDSFTLFNVPSDAIYLLVLKLTPPMSVDTSTTSLPLRVDVEVRWKLGNGYLGPVDYPLLPFFGVMCAVYAFFSVLWLIWCFWRWRDLLRIQYWIGAVIAIGLIEKMVFFSEYEKLNTSGTEAEGAVESAEILSAAKKSISTILVIIVSVGYGVVKPRLGSTLQKVVGLGLVYFLLCSIEGVVRVSKAQHESVKQKQIIVLPVLLLQLGLFYWMFTSLINTTRALRLRRNEVKLSLYRHFTHTLIFCVLASVCYMIWSFLTHHLSYCLKDWKELWVDVAFWHVLFSVLLFVIMVLWRPTINNQRYAFTPLLDNAEDDDEEDTVFSEAFTSSEAIKLRTGVSNQQLGTNSVKSKDNTANGLEDDLKWIEQHIPSSLADRALPAFVDSDEEREQVKFEVSKMQ